MSDKSYIFLGLVLIIGLFFNKKYFSALIIVESLASFYLPFVDYEIYLLSTIQVVIYSIAIAMIKSVAIRSAYALLIIYYTVDFVLNALYSVKQTMLIYELVYFSYLSIDAVWWVSCGWILLGLVWWDDSGTKHRDNGVCSSDNHILLSGQYSSNCQGAINKYKGMG